MNIVVLSGPNNGAIYVEGGFEASHDSLQRGCELSHVAKVMGKPLHVFRGAIEDGVYTIKYVDIKVGDEPYLDEHGEFPQNAKLLVGNYWPRGGV